MSTVIIWVAVLCGCGSKVNIQTADRSSIEFVSLPGATNFTATITIVTNSYDAMDKRAYRVTTDGKVFRSERHFQVAGWLAINERSTIEDACDDIDHLVWLAKEEAAGRFKRPVDTRTWSNVPPIMECDEVNRARR